MLALAAHMPSPAVPEVEKQIKSLRGTLQSLDGHWDTPGFPAGAAGGAPHRHQGVGRAPSAESASEFRYWARALNRQCRRFRDDLTRLVPEPWRFAKLPTLEELAAVDAVRSAVRDDLGAAGRATAARIRGGEAA